MHNIMQSVSVVSKFRTRQYVLKTDSPNLMLLAKISRYTLLYYFKNAVSLLLGSQYAKDLPPSSGVANIMILVQCY